MPEDQYSLVWNSFPRNLSSGLYTLLTDEHLVDVTLAAEGQILRAHKLILSVCSTYFQELFKGNSCKHPIVILKDVNYRDLSAMLHFMYQGEVSIKEEDIASFLKVAEALQVKGLTESNKKFKETLRSSRKNDEDEDWGFYEVERDKCDTGGTDENVSTFNRLIDIAKDESTTRQSTSREDNSTREKPCMLETSNINDTWQSCTEGDYSIPNVRTGIGEECRSADLSSGVEEQPLDCTSDANQPRPIKLEPLDYTMDADTDPEYGYATEKILYPSNENAQKQGLSDAAAYPGDFACETTHPSNKGRRTVRDIPGRSLPLEMTLRMVSQLGPTLRMEHGKSCLPFLPSGPLHHDPRDFLRNSSSFPRTIILKRANSRDIQWIGQCGDFEKVHFVVARVPRSSKLIEEYHDSQSIRIIEIERQRRRQEEIMKEHQLAETKQLKKQIYHLQINIYELRNKRYDLLRRFKQLLDEQLEIERQNYIERIRANFEDLTVGKERGEAESETPSQFVRTIRHTSEYEL